MICIYIYIILVVRHLNSWTSHRLHLNHRTAGTVACLGLEPGNSDTVILYRTSMRKHFWRQHYLRVSGSIRQTPFFVSEH